VENLNCVRSASINCAKSRKVAGSIPDGVFEIFHWLNPSGPTMTLGSTQPLIKVNTRNIPYGVKDGRCVGLRALPLLSADCLKILAVAHSWGPQDLSGPIKRQLLLFCKNFPSARSASVANFVSRNADKFIEKNYLTQILHQFL
jgi:hypothetical protein